MTRLAVSCVAVMVLVYALVLTTGGCAARRSTPQPEAAARAPAPKDGVDQADTGEKFVAPELTLAQPVVSQSERAAEDGHSFRINRDGSTTPSNQAIAEENAMRLRVEQQSLSAANAGGARGGGGGAGFGGGAASRGASDFTRVGGGTLSVLNGASTIAGPAEWQLGDSGTQSTFGGRLNNNAQSTGNTKVGTGTWNLRANRVSGIVANGGFSGIGALPPNGGRTSTDGWNGGLPIDPADAGRGGGAFSGGIAIGGAIRGAVFSGSAGPAAAPSTQPGAPGALNVPAPIAARPRTIVRANVSPDEVWFIVKPKPTAQADNDANPGTGALLAKLPGKTEQVPIPLKHTEVRGYISGYIATVNVQQQYYNSNKEKIEAVYVFPLPQNAAINEFLMTVGDRKIRGIIRDRAEAEQLYQEARQQGYVASLMTQERPNIFTQSVANIEPGKQIDIDIKYFHTLAYNDGWYEWVFPMVVGPRFNPPSSAGDGIGAVANGEAGRSGQKTEIQYLKPTQRSGHDISVGLQIDAGVKIEKIESVNHEIVAKIPATGPASVVLDSMDAIPNKDFVLRYKVAGDKPKSALMIQRDRRGNGGYFTLMIIPPETMTNIPRQPLEMVFTLDVSGSMNGQPIAQSRKAIQYALQHMQEDDTFQIVRFASQTQSMSEKPLPATKQNIESALKEIETTSAGGGTMMMEGIRKSLDFPADPQRLRFVAFLTDGFIGNEEQILQAVHSSLGDSRVFSFGVGRSPNRYLLDHMAKMGAGAAAYLSLTDSADEVMSAYFNCISHPSLTHISTDFGTMQATDVYPPRVPDLFVGRPVIITGRFTGHGQTDVKIKGMFNGQPQEFTIPVNLDDSTITHNGIESVWARMKIADLADRSVWDASDDFGGKIKQVALDYGLMSQFTAFVAVDSMTKTAGNPGATVAVPVPLPDGVQMENAIGPAR